MIDLHSPQQHHFDFLIQSSDKRIQLLSTMEPNCCLFPAPPLSKFGTNITKILLIPKIQNQDCCYYHDRYLLKQQQPSNQFIEYCSRRKGIKLTVSATTAKDNQTQSSATTYPKLKKETQNNVGPYMATSQLLLAEKNHSHKLEKVVDWIPCLFIPGINKDKIVIFFHGNGEDINSAYEFAFFISNQLKTSILIMEYPGYSVYGGTASPAAVLADADRVILFLQHYGFKPQDMILFGRSIGGAIALQLASNYCICSLILLSPFLSLKKIVEDLCGKAVSCFISDTLNNQTTAPKVKCPVLLLHGLKDELVPYHHSIYLLGYCKGYSRLKLIPDMTHFKFNFHTDFMQPVKKFLSDVGVMKFSS